MTVVDLARLAHLLQRERADHEQRNPRSAAASRSGHEHLVGGVPMTWMAKWSGGFPLFLADARGNRITDLAP